MEPGSSTAPGGPALAVGVRTGEQIAADVFVEDVGWRKLIPGCDRIAARAAAVAGGAGSVVLSSDRAVRVLNARHRGRNKPTNVLTFEPAMPGLEGEIVLALGTVRREALAAGKPPADHLAHLVVHGCLHLQGYDHEQAGDARRMEMEEARLLSRLGVPNPWRLA
jgi:probable rRNA maturation factor